MEPTWPIRLDDRLFNLKIDGGVIKAVSVTFADINTSQAPQIVQDRSKEIATSINIGGSFRLRAERDVRSWQAILAPYLSLDIHFDHPTMSYHAETADEESQIAIQEFTSSSAPRRFRGRDEFAIYGRAFLAVQHGYDQIDRMAFYLEGVRAMEAQRPIDAYNNFYLWFESNYGIPFKTKDAIAALLKHTAFVDALKQGVDDPETRPKSKDTPLKASLIDPLDIRQLIKEIVLLRGFLRHHSLSNPARWDPSIKGAILRKRNF